MSLLQEMEKLFSPACRNRVADHQYQAWGEANTIENISKYNTNTITNIIHLKTSAYETYQYPVCSEANTIHLETSANTLQFNTNKYNSLENISM